jgi:hypothetical protein
MSGSKYINYFDWSTLIDIPNVTVFVQYKHPSEKVIVEIKSNMCGVVSMPRDNSNIIGIDTHFVFIPISLKTFKTTSLTPKKTMNTHLQPRRQRINYAHTSIIMNN